MPVYDYSCTDCGRSSEVYTSRIDSLAPTCCGKVMTRLFTTDVFRIKSGYPSFIDRMSEIHKAQAQRGERFRYIHPKEVSAT